MVAIWIVLTAIVEFLALRFLPLPVAAADEAEIVDNAFRFLTALAIPVFTFVLTWLVYSVGRFRSRGEPATEGPAIHSHGPAVAAWLAVSGGLTIIMIVHPGVTGMSELAAHASKESDLVVQAEGSRWFWRITYPAYQVTTTKELVLPVGKHVRFEVSATDVLHAFWVPAFRMKIDAVPGMVTTVHATPNKMGAFTEDPSFRLQCGELCGLFHTDMTVPVRIVDQKEFDGWLSQQRGRPGG